ncbi:MAG: MBL fold metallo-hydrolase [Clostridia bacterium]|nr:MBL fold metallo-hydrolase [Clostridia bacterium]
MKKYIWMVLPLLVLTLSMLWLPGCTGTPAETGTEQNWDTMLDAVQHIAYIDPAGLSEETFAPDSGEHTVRMLFVNAGKADCIILEADGLTYLIDTGEDNSVPKILAGLAYMETESIAGVFLTHTDKDHIGGWETILQAYPVEKLYTAVIREAPDTYLKMAGEIPYETLMPGQSVPMGGGGLYLDVLCPIRLYPEEENNNSLILRLDCGEETVLFAGDMKAEEEADLLSTGYNLDCTVLKVPYHGRKDGSGEAFLAACTPELSIICCDTETDPDTAHKKAVARLREHGEVRLTEDTELGWYVTLEGKYRYISNAQIMAERTADLSLESVSVASQTLTIRNNGDDADLSGYYIHSDRGNEVYVFPAGTVLAAGESISVGCVGTDGDLLWKGETSVWHKSKEDNAVLYDRFGNVLDTAAAK